MDSVALVVEIDAVTLRALSLGAGGPAPAGVPLALPPPAPSDVVLAPGRRAAVSNRSPRCAPCHGGHSARRRACGRASNAPASIGIAEYPPDSVDAGTLFRPADAAMYHAKRSNRRVAFYETEMEALSAEHLRLESELRHAIERGELVLHYKSELDAATGRPEALMRWQHPQGGLIGTDHFIPLAEDIGLIAPIGAWVLDPACAQLGAWRAAPGPRVAINFSAVQLQDRDVVDTVRRVLDVA